MKSQSFYPPNFPATLPKLKPGSIQENCWTAIVRNEEIITSVSAVIGMTDLTRAEINEAFERLVIRGYLHRANRINGVEMFICHESFWRKW